MSTEDQSRAAFEAWARENLPGVNLSRCKYKPDLYEELGLDIRWRGFLLGWCLALMSNATPEVDGSAGCVEAARQEALTQAIRECAELSDHFDAKSNAQAAMGAARCLMAICALADPLQGKESPR